MKKTKPYFSLSNMADNQDTSLEKEEDSTSREQDEIFGSPVVPDEKEEPKEPIEESVDNRFPDLVDKKEIVSGLQHTIKTSREVNANSPDLTGGDIDADWKTQPNTTGEEASMGTNATPDKDSVEDLSAPWGTTYGAENELNVGKETKRLEREREEDEDSGQQNK